MRTMTAQDAKVAAAPMQADFLRVEIRDADGTWQNLSSLQGRDWVVSVDWGADTDTPVSECRVTLHRSEYYLSLAAGVDTSRINLNAAGAYSPLVELNRDVRLRGAVWPAGYTPAEADLVTLWEGFVWSVDDGSESTITVVCQDLGGRVQRTFIEDPRVYGSAAGVALETVMQSVLNDNGLSSVTLYTPTSPAWSITPAYTQSQMSTLEALQVLAELRGWSVRYKWDSGTSAHRLTLYQVDRSASVAAYVFTTSQYRTPQQYARDLSAIRNAIRVRYRDSATGARTAITTLTDAASISKYGRQYAEVVEGDDSPIDSSAEATVLGNALLSDLAEPRATLAVPLAQWFPWVEVADLYGFAADGQRFTSQQDLAVVSYQHRFARGRGETTLTLRGRPAGAYERWQRRIIPSAETTLSLIAEATVSLNANAATVTVTADTNASALVWSEYTSGAWGADTQFATGRTGTFNQTASTTADRLFRVAAKNLAGLTGEYREVRVPRVAVGASNTLVTAVDSAALIGTTTTAGAVEIASVNAAATIPSARTLDASTVMQSLSVVRGLKAGSNKNGDAITFTGVAFTATPVLHFGFGGQSYESSYSATDHGPIVQALNLDQDGFTLSAKVRQLGATVTSYNVTFSGDTATKNRTDDAWDDTYTFLFDVTVNAGVVNSIDPLAPRDPSSITLYFYTNDGSGESLRAERTYSNSGSTSASYTAQTVPVVADGMGNLDTFRIVVAATEGDGGSVTRTNVSWGEATVTETAMPATAFVPWLAIGGAS